MLLKDFFFLFCTLYSDILKIQDQYLLLDPNFQLECTIEMQEMSYLVNMLVM